jgi:hypothetical protein
MVAKGFDTDTELTAAVVDAALAAGYSAAGRYIKNLQPLEVGICKAKGFKLWSISEGMGDAATMALGYARGYNDGLAAAALARKLGQPFGTRIFAAVDYDASGSQDIANVDSYMTGFVAGCPPYTMGVYGDGAVLSSLPAYAAYVAGADGWAGTEAYLASTNNAALVQHATIEFAGISIDPCDIYDESVLWLADGAQSAPPPAPPTSGPLIAMPALTDLQRTLNSIGYDLAIDGIWGPQTAAAIASYYGK